MKMRKIISGVLMAALMAASLLGSMGCGKADNIMTQDGSGTEADAGENAQGTNKAMGRYVETVNSTLEDMVYAGTKIQRMDDGSLVAFDRHKGMFVSKDEGKTWELKPLAWHEELAAKDEVYIMNIAVSKDGYIGVIYSENDNSKDAENKTSEAETEESETEMEESETETAEWGEKETEETGETETDEAGGIELETGIDYRIHPKILLAAPDGSITEFEIPYEGSEYLENLEFSDDGRLFGAALGGRIYEIDRADGSYELITELSDWAFSLAVCDNILLCENTEGITIYDMEKDEIIEDNTLDEFITSEFGGKLEFVNMTAVPILMLPETENILYLICEKGIYRHAIGGSMLEQLTDGTLTSLNDPRHQIMDGMLLEDGAFQILFWGGTLINYIYDPDMPTLPDIQLRAYSLEENYAIKRAISNYQSSHPEVYIKYETGMSGESSVTREDALKKLNTEIAAGTCPDIMIMDNMPVESYIGKGILMDLTPYLENLDKENYFTNVLNTFKTDAGTYAVPVEFEIPLLAGDGKLLSQTESLNNLAELLELCREEKPQGSLLGVMSEDILLGKIMPAGMAAWKKADREIDEEALVSFFETAKRIWDAESAGITQQMKAEHEEMMNQMLESMGMSGFNSSEYFLQIGSSAIDYAVGKQEFIVGSLNDSLTFDTLVSTFKIKGRTTGDYTLIREKGEGVFIPATFVGISATSKYQDIAGELLKKMLEGEVIAGFPVNKEEWRKRMLVNTTDDGEAYGSMMISDENDYTVTLDVYPASEEEITKLLQTADGAAVPYIKDAVIESAVYEAGKKVLGGEITAEKGAEEVINKVAIYMAE